MRRCLGRAFIVLGRQQRESVRAFGLSTRSLVIAEVEEVGRRPSEGSRDIAQEEHRRNIDGLTFA